MNNEEKLEIDKLKEYKKAAKHVKELQVAGVNSKLRISLQDRAYYFTVEKLSQFKKKSQIKALNPGKEEAMRNSTTEGHRAFAKGLEANVSEKEAIKNIESTNRETEKEETITK